MQTLEHSETTVGRAPVPASETGGSDVPVAFVKWETPTDELLGVAKVVRHLIDRHGIRASDVCIAAPHRAWVVQAQRACASEGLDTAACIPSAHASSAARIALAKLSALVCPDGDDARTAWSSAERDEVEAFADAYRGARGFTLVRALGLDKVPEAECALLHVRGDETAAQLHELVREQIAHPTLPDHAAVVPVSCIDSLDQPYAWLFLVGCVDGLVPGPRAYEAASELDRAAAHEEARLSFRRALGLARVQTVVSSFCKIDAETARRAHIRSARFKTEHGVRLAMAAPTPLMREAGSRRPTTVGGQAYLRSYGLN